MTNRIRITLAVVRGRVGLVVFLVAFALGSCSHAAPNSQSSQPVLVAEGVDYIKTNFAAADARYRKYPGNSEAAWQLGRATFDRADIATNDVERAMLAEKGIEACENAVSRQPKLAAAHYYLGMNLGQLARTKELSALRIVKRMEKEFMLARELDEKFDYAGPDRNVGLLYREAPPVLSIGSRKDARVHLLRAIELAPQYPENQLNLVEAYLKWGDRSPAEKQMKALEAMWAAARTNFTGVAWVSSWADWDDRRRKCASRLGDPSKAAGK